MKKGMLLLVLVLALTVLQQANLAYASELTDDYFDIATNYANSNNSAKALEYLDIILSLEPDNIKAKDLKTKILSPCQNNSQTNDDNTKVQDADQSSETLVDTITYHSETEKVVYNSDYYNKKGKEFYQKKEFDTAIEYFYKAIKIDNKNVQAYNNLAMSFWFKNNICSAVKYFKKANSINKTYTQPLVNLAALYKQSGDKKNQLLYLKKAIKSNPNDYLAYYWLGDYYKNEGKYPQAIENLKEVVKINPKFSPAYLDLAMSFFETEEFNYALMAINQYLGLCPNSDFALSLMSKTYLALCRYEDAKTYIEKAIEINDCSEYQLELAKIEYFLENYNGALDIFEKLLKTSESAEIFNYIGLCNYKLKNIEASIINFNKAIDLDGLKPIYYYNLAQCYKSLGDKQNYTKYVNMAVKINPINYQDFIDLSYIYYDNGNPAYAINSLNGAILKYPEVKSLYLSKLKIYEAMGDNLHYNETKDQIEMRFNKK